MEVTSLFGQLPAAHHRDVWGLNPQSDKVQTCSKQVTCLQPSVLQHTFALSDTDFNRWRCRGELMHFLDSFGVHNGSPDVGVLVAVTGANSILPGVLADVILSLRCRANIRRRFGERSLS